MLGPLTHGNINHRLFFGLAIFVMIIMLMPQTAHAAGSAMPWEGPLTSILQSIEGPVAKIFGTIAIIMTCLLYTSPSPRDQRGSRMPSSA